MELREGKVVTARRLVEGAYRVGSAFRKFGLMKEPPANAFGGKRDEGRIDQQQSFVAQPTDGICGEFELSGALNAPIYQAFLQAGSVIEIPQASIGSGLFAMRFDGRLMECCEQGAEGLGLACALANGAIRLRTDGTEGAHMQFGAFLPVSEDGNVAALRVGLFASNCTGKRNLSGDLTVFAIGPLAYGGTLAKAGTKGRDFGEALLELARKAREGFDSAFEPFWGQYGYCNPRLIIHFEQDKKAPMP